MTRTSTSSASPRPAASAALAPAVVAPLRPRRSPRLLIAGVLAVCLGVLAAVGLYVQGHHAQQVLRVTRAIPRGGIVQAADLGVVSLPETPGLATLPASSLHDVVGQEALTDLPEGSLLGPHAVGRSVVSEGTVHVGLKLGPGRAPIRAVPVSAPVLLITVAGSAPQAAVSPAPAAASYHAIVVTAPAMQPDGTQILDVAVGAQDVSRIATLAAQEQLVLVREAER